MVPCPSPPMLVKTEGYPGILSGQKPQWNLGLYKHRSGSGTKYQESDELLGHQMRLLCAQRHHSVFSRWLLGGKSTDAS